MKDRGGNSQLLISDRPLHLHFDVLGHEHNSTSYHRLQSQQYSLHQRRAKDVKVNIFLDSPKIE